MIIENSGKCYRFPLEHNLGFGYAETLDYTDITKFSGKIIFSYDIFQKKHESPIPLEEIRNYSKLISFHPLLSFPNIKGRDSWQLVGQAIYLKEPEIIFKDISSILKNDDWSSLWGWHTYTNFKQIGPIVPYESVRKFELPTLYEKKAIQIRSTFHVLLSNEIDIKTFYDLKNNYLKRLYVEHLNTSLPKEKSNSLLSSLRQ